jgi:transketolase
VKPAARAMASGDIAVARPPEVRHDKFSRADPEPLRDFESDLEGHPTPRLPFIDVATGSLGQGLGVGVGLALGARFAGSAARVFGDGETAEGSVWEAAQMAGHRALDNLVAVVDVNALGQSGPTMLGHDVDAYRRRFAAFGWRVQTIDGHDVPQIVAALRRARRTRGAPSAIIARTLKGKGIAEVEGQPGWHGKPLPPDAAERAIAALESRLHHVPPPAVQHSRAHRVEQTRAPSEPETRPPVAAGAIATREAYGEGLVRLGATDPRIVVLDGDVKNSTYAERFVDAYPDRYVEGFIAEPNMVSVAAGMAAQGFIPFVSSFACFLTRAADQIRMTGISRSNLKLCGSHAGVAASYQGLVYIRTTRMKTEAVYGPDKAFAIGGSKVVRSREGDRLTIVGAGITLHEALAAADELAAKGMAVRVVDLYCLKPLARVALLEAARATGGKLLTVEDHYAEGGLGAAEWRAARAARALRHRPRGDRARGGGDPGLITGTARQCSR